MAIYALTAAKGGPKLKATTLDPSANPAGPPPLTFVVALPVLRLAAHYASMEDFAAQLQRVLQQPVADQTGLTDATISTSSLRRTKQSTAALLKAPRTRASPPCSRLSMSNSA